MAKRRRSRGRRGRNALRWGLATLLLAALVAGGVGWWKLIHWMPARDAYPVQGLMVGARDGVIDFRAYRAVGADFAYLEASQGARGRDPAFARNLTEAQAAGLKVGVVHRFDPCERAERQSANFVTIVPRDAVLLPPAVELDETASACSIRIVDGAVESELVTFVNQIEAHVGKPVVLRVSPRFQKTYRIAGTLKRDLWLDRLAMQPDYAGRPWRLWTANTMLRTEAGAGPVRWVVAQP